MSFPSHRTAPLLAALTIGVAVSAPLEAATVSLSPTYLAAYTDAVTGDNCTGMTKTGGCTGSGWSVDPGADIYGSDIYERPTSQTFSFSGGEFVSKEYLAYLDLVSAQYGYDDDYLYFQLNVYSPYLYKEDGTVDTGVFGSGTYYGVQIGVGDDPGTYLLRGEQDKSTVETDPNATLPLFDSSKTQGFYDCNDEVAGTGGVTTPDEGTGGYGCQPISTDGYLEGTNTYLLYSRSYYNADGTVSIELALNYTLLNAYCLANGCAILDPTSIPTLVFETTRGLKDPQNYLWNDEYSFDEAGSPYYSALNPGGTENIYELDNMRVGYRTPDDPGDPTPVPEPASLTLLGLGLVGIASRFRRRR